MGGKKKRTTDGLWRLKGAAQCPHKGVLDKEDALCKAFQYLSRKGTSLLRAYKGGDCAEGVLGPADAP